MSEEAAILAQFSDWRTVKGRKVLQLIFEVPLEEQAKVLTHLGAPMPMADLWCGIARVARKGKAGEANSGSSEADAARDAPSAPARLARLSDEAQSASSSPAHKPKRRWQDMPASQRAAMLVHDPEFWKFAEDYTVPTNKIEDATAADVWLKGELNVKSKAEIRQGHNATYFRFESIEADFRAWRQARGHGVI